MNASTRKSNFGPFQHDQKVTAIFLSNSFLSYNNSTSDLQTQQYNTMAKKKHLFGPQLYMIFLWFIKEQQLENKRYPLPLDINFMSFILRGSVSKLHENAAAVLREDGVGLKN